MPYICVIDIIVKVLECLTDVAFVYAKLVSYISSLSHVRELYSNWSSWRARFYYGVFSAQLFSFIAPSESRVPSDICAPEGGRETRPVVTGPSECKQ